MEEEIDNERLISLVEARPVLWDKDSLMYRDRHATKNGWSEVCCELYNDYEDMSEREKKQCGKVVIRRWTNIRDAYTKSKRRLQECKKMGFKIKKYVYNNQLHFLAKFYDPKESVDDFDINDSNDGLPVKEQLEVTQEDNTHRFAKRKRQEYSPGKKKRKEDEIEFEKLLKALEGESDSHMSFFQGVLPHLRKYDDSEVLEFQTGVLRLISIIDEKRKTFSHHFQQPLSNHYNSPCNSLSAHSMISQNNSLHKQDKKRSVIQTARPSPSPAPSESSENSIDFAS